MQLSSWLGDIIMACVDAHIHTHIYTRTHTHIHTYISTHTGRGPPMGMTEHSSSYRRVTFSFRLSMRRSNRRTISSIWPAPQAPPHTTPTTHIHQHCTCQMSVYRRACLNERDWNRHRRYTCMYLPPHTPQQYTHALCRYYLDTVHVCARTCMRMRTHRRKHRHKRKGKCRCTCAITFKLHTHLQRRAGSALQHTATHCDALQHIGGLYVKLHTHL